MSSNRYYIWILLAFILFSHQLLAQEDWYVSIGSGGYTGDIKLGIGYSPVSKLIPELSLEYGYAEAFSRDIHSLECKAQWGIGIKKLNNFRVKGGASLAWYQAPNVFIKLPSHFPENYYRPTAFQGLLHVGISKDWSWSGDVYNHKAGLSLSWVALMSQAWNASSNKIPTWPDITTFSIKLRYYVPTETLQSP